MKSLREHLFRKPYELTGRCKLKKFASRTLSVEISNIWREIMNLVFEHHRPILGGVFDFSIKARPDDMCGTLGGKMPDIENFRCNLKWFIAVKIAAQNNNGKVESFPHQVNMIIAEVVKSREKRKKGQ